LRRCQFGVVGANRRGARPFTELQICYLVEAFWNVAPQQVRALYTKGTQTPVGFPK
jgi:hypothetical protein